MKPFNTLGILGKIGNVVYQRTQRGHGNVEGDPTRTLQVRRYVATKPPGTPHQQEHRARFRAAVHAWHALTPEQQKSYKQRASRRAILGFNLFISEYMRGV